MVTLGSGLRTRLVTQGRKGRDFIELYKCWELLENIVSRLRRPLGKKSDEVLRRQLLLLVAIGSQT